MRVAGDFINASDEMNEANLRGTKLYHFTSLESAGLLLDGLPFRPDDEGFVWFAEFPPMAMGEASRDVLLEVTWDLPRPKLDEFKHRIELEDVDEPEDEFDGLIPTFYWYAIPAAVVNAQKPGLRIIERGSEEWWDLS